MRPKTDSPMRCAVPTRRVCRQSIPSSGPLQPVCQPVPKFQILITFAASTLSNPLSTPMIRSVMSAFDGAADAEYNRAEGRKAAGRAARRRRGANRSIIGLLLGWREREDV